MLCPGPQSSIHIPRYNRDLSIISVIFYAGNTYIPFSRHLSLLCKSSKIRYSFFVNAPLNFIWSSLLSDLLQSDIQTAGLFLIPIARSMVCLTMQFPVVVMIHSYIIYSPYIQQNINCHFNNTLCHVR